MTSVRATDAVAPLADQAGVAALREALAGFTVDAVAHLLGPAGGAAHRRGDLTGAQRAIAGADGELATLVRLFLLGATVSEAEARAALREVPSPATAALLEPVAGEVRARVEIRPYGIDGDPGGADRWVVSDFGSDARPGPLAADHVLGIGGASLTLAGAVIRTPVSRALDVGTGCGVQALHLSGHAQQVVATDVSARALRLAATTAALNGLSWDLRKGSLLEPVDGERFDLIVANPPFVVSPGLAALRRAGGGHSYRDSGLAGDAVTERLLRGVPGLLAPGGSAQMLANWIIPEGSATWSERLEGWLAGGRCHAWVWQREVVEPGEYVQLWLRDAGHDPVSAPWRELYRTWLDWLAAAGVAAVGMGLVALWPAGGEAPLLAFEDVPQQVAGPVGALLPGWLRRRRWLAGHGDEQLLAARLRVAPSVRRVVREAPGPGGWRAADVRLEQESGMRWQVETDAAISAVVAGCDGSTPLGTLLLLLAAASGLEPADAAAAAVPVVRDLVERGFLEPGPG